MTWTKGSENVRNSTRKGRSRLQQIVAWSGLGLLATPLAGANEKPTVVVVPYQAMNKGITGDLLEQTTVTIAEEFKAAGIEVLEAKEIPSGATASKPSEAAGPSGDPAKAKEALDLVERGKLAIDDGEPKTAIEQLEKAIQLLEEHGDVVPDLRVLSDAYLALAVASFQEGREDEADEALTSAVHFGPFRTLEESDYPPIFIRAFERVRFNVLNRPRARIELKAEEGAEVLFDGKNLGKAPMVLKDALPGKHWVRVERGGKVVDVKKVQVKGKSTILVEFGGGGPAEAPEAGGLLGAIAKNEVSEADVKALVALGKKQNAAWLMFGGIYKTETAYNIYSSLVDVKGEKVGRLVDIAFDLDMLSAQIEVYKLAEDLGKQTGAKQLAKVVSAFPLKLAPDVKARRAPDRAVASGKVATVAAAPPPVGAPKVAEVPSEEGAGPVASANGDGRKIVAAEPAGVKIAPKDENPNRAIVVPRDEDKDDDGGGSLWWVWLIAGVAVAAGAGAGGYFLLANQGGDQATLSIQW